MNKNILMLVLGILVVGGVFVSGVEQTVTVTVLNGTDIVNESTGGVCLFDSSDVSLIADVYFNDCLGEVWVSVKINDGSWVNYSVLTHTDETYSFLLNNSLIDGGDIVYWQYFARDCYNYTYNGSLQNFTVVGHTYLGVSVWPADGQNGWHVTAPIFSLNSFVPGDIYYQWDSDDIFDYTVPFGLENIPNAPPKESAGVLDLNWWVDSSCGVEERQTLMLYIDLTDPLITDLSPADDELVINNLRPEISAYLDEIYQSNSGINENSVVMMLDGVVVPAIVTSVGIDATVSYVSASDLLEGTHEVYIYVEDNAGRSSELNWSFELVSSVSPTMEIYSPRNGTYTSKRVPFNVSLSDDVEKIEYINWMDNNPKWGSLCKDCNEYGFFRERTKNLKEGWNNISIRVLDYFGQMNEENISLFVDSKVPKISRVEPKKGKYTNGSDFYIKYTEDNLENLSITFNPTKILALNDCVESKRYEECYFDLNLTEYNGQEIEYYFTIEDIAGNIGESKKTKVNVDTVAPIINNSNDFWYQGAERYARYIYFDINITELNFDEVVYSYIDYKGRLKEKRLCGRLKDGGCSTKKSFRKGETLLNVRAIDEAGNSAVEEINFEVNY